MGKRKKQGRVIGRRHNIKPEDLITVREVTQYDVERFFAGFFPGTDELGPDEWDRSGASRPSDEDLAYLKAHGYVEVEPNRWVGPLHFGIR